MKITMPIPNPKQNEKVEDYLARCSADPIMLAEYPDNEQRVAVCNANFTKAFDNAQFTKRKDTVEEAEIFSVGRWNGLQFSAKDLQGIVDAFNSLSEFHKVPLKLGHNKEQKVTDGQPAIGWVDDIWIEGKKLMARFIDVPKIVMDAIKKKLYRTVSVELLRGVKFKGKNFSNVLDAVALLGADIPAVGNLADLKKLMSREELTSDGMLCFSAINGNLKEESTMTPEEEAALRAQLATANAKVATAEAETTVAESQVATFAAADKVRDEADKKAKVEMSRKTVTDLFEAAVVAKQITPAKRTLFERTLGVDDDEAVVGISLDDVKALIGDSKVKDFSKENSSSESGDDETGESTDDSDQQLSDKAYEYMDANPGVSFDRATIAVMSRNRKLAKEYMDSNDNRESA